MKDKILEIINLIREKNSKSPLKSIQITDNLRNDIGLDSLDLAELTVRIENEFGVDVFEDGIVETIKEIIDKLEKR
ncbi:MAG: phosphopantetheine-binding protein [Candidatus Woesearchaeota archaeon]